MANNVRYTAAKRREIAALRAAEAEAADRHIAGLTAEEYLAEVAADYDRTHNSDVAAGEDVNFFLARHAELVAKYAATA